MISEFVFPTPEAAQAFVERELGLVGVAREHMVVRVHADALEELQAARVLAHELGGKERQDRAENAARVEAFLLMYVRRKERVRVFLGDPATGEDWGEENMVSGYIGRSTGRLKVPLMLARRNSTGGPAILTGNVLRILVEGREVYKHEKYVPIAWETRDEGPAELPFQVLRRGEVHAQFLTAEARARWLAFMRGERMAK